MTKDSFLKKKISPEPNLHVLIWQYLKGRWQWKGRNALVKKRAIYCFHLFPAVGLECKWCLASEK